MTVLKSMAVLVLLAITSSCATWTADKCQSTNWDAQGFADGSVGRNNAAGFYASKCQKKGVNINSGAYNVGYDRGLGSFCNYNKGHETAFSGQAKLPICSSVETYNSGYAKGAQEYCTAQNGYKVAVDGGDQAKICSGAGFKAFMSGYMKGRKKFVVEEISNLKEDIQKASKDLDQARDELADKQYQLSRVPKYSYEPSVIRLRQELESDVQRLMKERDDIKGQVDNMSDRLRQLEKESKTN